MGLHLSMTPRTVKIDECLLQEGALKSSDSASDRRKVFPISATCLRLAWNRARKKAGISDLRFHDLRHEASVRFFEMGMSVQKLHSYLDIRM